MKTLGILQARLSSSRFPGKVLMPILGQPMIFRQIDRLNRCKNLSGLIVATSVDPSDDRLAAECMSRDIQVWRGSLDDVLARFYQAAKSLRPDHVVRLTGDCPLADSDLIDALIDYHFKGRFDYSSNALELTYPDGLDAEIITFQTLEKAWKQASLPSEREHVTPYIYKHPELFRIGAFTGSPNLSHLRLTVDEADDFELISKIFENLLPISPAFGLSDILRLFEAHPELVRINAGHKRNEGYTRSLQKDSQKSMVEKELS